MRTNNHDVLLAGIPRSGTTMVCSLLNRVPDVLALVEPMDVAALWRNRSKAARMDNIQNFFREQRADILTSKTAKARVTSGLFDDNTFSDELDANGLRKTSLSLERVRVEKKLSSEFTLVVKHPNALTAILDDITDRFACFAVIRNPVAVLASWNTLSIPLRDGHAPAAENLDRVLRDDLKRCSDRWERQVRLINWYFERYAALLPRDRIIRYEQVIATGGRALDVIDPAASDLNERLENRNASSLYNPGVVTRVSAALAARGGAWRKFYSDIQAG